MYINVNDRTMIRKLGAEPEDVYDVLTDELHDMKEFGIIEEHIEPTDIFLDESGNAYYASEYMNDYSQVEGHGMHTICDSYPVSFVSLLEKKDVIRRIEALR